jgi:NAD(P)H-dependent FMN reductase
VLVTSTRPGRIGPAIGAWMFEQAKTEGEFEVELVDLKDFELPVFDEPSHPRFKKYEHEHTKRWSDKVSEADAFVFVTPEYDFGTPAPLMNALQYLFTEWHYKPVAFASYGGVSGGLRGVQMTKQVVTAMKMAPIVEAVTIAMASQQIDKETKVFLPTEMNNKAAQAMVKELHRWATAMKTLRG